MKKTLIFCAVFGICSLNGIYAQNQPTQQTSAGIQSKKAPAGNQKATPVDGLKRKGSGKMASGVSRNGDTNLSPVQPTSTQGSTSQGSASEPSGGGAKGSGVAATQPKISAKSTKNGTASDGGLTSGGTPTYGAKVSTKSTSGATGGSQRPTSTGTVQKEAKTPDANVSTNGPQPTGPGKPGTPAGNAAGKKAGGNAYPKTGKKAN